jgi:iron complex outermembrane receptor protein
MKFVTPSRGVRAKFAFASLTVLAALAAGPQVVRAESQPAADAGAAANAGVVAEVLVTAQKRSENIKQVPLSVSVLSGSDLQVRRIADYRDLSRATPSVSFNTWNGAEGRDNIVIRGVSSTSGQATVGVYLDDVSITVPNLYRDGAAEPRLPDIQSVEVLRGPQGTLWGASSEGGTVRFISEPPNMSTYGATLTADSSYTVHGGGNVAGSIVLDAPVVPDVFALRASANYINNSGYIDNYDQAGALAHRGVNGEQSATLHLVGKYTPSPDLTITPALFYQKVHDDENGAFYPALGLWKQNKQVQEHGTDGVFLASLTVRKDFGFAELTSVTGAFERIYNRQEDGTYFNSTAFAEFFLDPLFTDPNNLATYQSFYNSYNLADLQQADDTILANLPSRVEFHTRYQQASQELRLSSNGDAKSKLKWVAGFYFSYEKVHNTDFQRIGGINSTFQSIYGVPLEQSPVEQAYGGPGVTLFPGDVDEADDRTYQEYQYAVFGQVDYEFLPDWRLGVGGRYVAANETFVSTEYGFYQLSNISPFHQAANFTSFTPKVTLAHMLDADSSAYFSAGQGFRLGGPTGPTPFGPTSVCAGDFAAIGQTTNPTQFASDSLWTYEVGTKTALFDHRLSLNAAAFYTDWSNIQQQIYLPTCGYYFTTNVGNAAIYGGEVEAQARLTDHLGLFVTASGASAKITKTNNPSAVAVGQYLIDTPAYTVTAGVSYTTELPGDYRLTARFDYDYTGQSYGSYQPANPDYRNPAYGVANASLTLSHDSYEIALYVKNAFDNRQIIQQPEINTVIEGYTVRPLTAGVTVKASF